MREMIGYSSVEMKLLTFVFIAPIVAIIIVLSLRKNSKGRKLPGDGWPVMSIASMTTSSSPTILTDFIKAQICRHGKIFTARFLGKKILFSADPDLNTFVVQNENKLFDNDFPSHIRVLLGQGDLFVLAHDDRYKNIKSMIVNFFNSWEIQTTYLEYVQNATDQVLNTWRHKDVVYASEEAMKFVSIKLLEKIMGLSAEDPDGEQLCRDFLKIDQGMFAVPINLPFTCYWKAIKARKNIVRIIKKSVESKKIKEKNNTEGAKYDWIDWILDSDPHQSIERISDTVISIAFAVVINSAKLTDLAIYFLGNCPKAVQQMRDEYLQIMGAKKDGNTKLIWEDYKNLKFSHCVIDEILRLGNIIPGISKKAKQDIDFKGYVIPKGITVMPYMAGSHLDPSAFERPEEFDPWRWQNMKKSNTWMPFGGGVRRCNGGEFARMETIVFLIRIINNFNFEPAEPDHPIAHPVSFPKKLPIKLFPLN